MEYPVRKRLEKPPAQWLPSAKNESRSAVASPCDVRQLPPIFFGLSLYRGFNRYDSVSKGPAGGGIDGCVQPQPNKQILSHLARGSDPSVRIKALEALAKLQEREDDAKRSDPEPTLEETLVAVIAALPMSGLGACMAMGTWFDRAKSVATFPFLELAAPIVAQNFPS